MTIRIERSIDDPIVTFVFEGPLDPYAVHDVDEKAAQLLQEMGMFYAILDIRGTQMTFGEALALFESLRSPASPVKFVFVGEPVPHDPTGDPTEKIFSNKDEAVEYILQDIAAHASSGHHHS